jgi:hypothetical protein
MKKPLMFIGGLISLFITIPIWYFLVYSILQAIHADRLVWFLFWIYLPAGIFAQIIEKVAKWGDE